MRVLVQQGIGGGERLETEHALEDHPETAEHEHGVLAKAAAVGFTDQHLQAQKVRGRAGEEGVVT